jgi:hypothetical protein
MKRITFLLMAMCLTWFVNAQIMTPQPSPMSKIEQKVGLTDVTVEYSRPSAKGREVFGENGIVPYGAVWRTGANAATKISFSDDVTIEGKDLAKGTYALLSKPGNDKWDFHFYTFDSPGYGTYLEKTPDLVVTVMPKKIGHNFETMLIDFSNFSTSETVMSINWGMVHVPLNIGVPTDAKVMASIDKVMAGPSAGDYYTAGSYLHDAGKDLSKALEWVQKATHGENPRFWQVRKEALILADLGRYKEAIDVANKSKDLAAAVDYDEYVKMNEKSIAEWTKKLK